MPKQTVLRGLERGVLNFLSFYLAQGPSADDAGTTVLRKRKEIRRWTADGEHQPRGLMQVRAV